MVGDSSLRARLADDWALPDATVEAHHGGMGSATWLVSQDGRRWVATAVAPALRAQFAGGLSVATMLDAAGVPAGRRCRPWTGGPWSTSVPPRWPC